MSITKTAPLRAELSLEWCLDVTYRCLYVRKGKQLLQQQYTKKQRESQINSILCQDISKIPVKFVYVLGSCDAVRQLTRAIKKWFFFPAWVFVYKLVSALDIKNCVMWFDVQMLAQFYHNTFMLKLNFTTIPWTY